MNIQFKPYFIVILLTTLLVIVSYFFFFRLDLTTDKRYSISENTKSILKNTQYNLTITLYLDGDLNSGFTQLKKSTVELLEDMSVYSHKSINFNTVNPSDAQSDEDRNRKYAELVALGMTPTSVYERDKEGKSIQKVVFPWVLIKYNGKQVVVNLLKNIRGNSGEENLNISIENLEYEIMDGVRRVINTTVSKIAFIEGHGELNEAETYDISKTLSNYFQIDRGVLGVDASILNTYKAIIIAKPTEPFSETDKYIIDQYIMNGGRVLWLLDGVRISRENLSTSGISPALEYDLNLSDQLFRYGMRLNPVILQDVQCVSIPVNIAPAGADPQFEPSPWYFAPLLLTSYQHPVSKNITEVKADFCSFIELVGENKNVSGTLLLATSGNTHVISTPTTINVSDVVNPDDKQYFNRGFLPVAVLMEGNFDSNFKNRIIPKEIVNSQPFVSRSNNTKQIFIADGDIIRNETNGIASDTTTLALGYDRFMNQQFGNKDFIQNAVLYLTDDAGWFDLRSRTVKLRLLNKKLIVDEKLKWQLINILLPLILLLIVGGSYQLIRKRKYTR